MHKYTRWKTDTPRSRGFPRGHMNHFVQKECSVYSSTSTKPLSVKESHRNTLDCLNKELRNPGGKPRRASSTSQPIRSFAVLPFKAFQDFCGIVKNYRFLLHIKTDHSGVLRRFPYPYKNEKCVVWVSGIATSAKPHIAHDVDFVTSPVCKSTKSHSLIRTLKPFSLHFSFDLESTFRDLCPFLSRQLDP